MSQPREISMCNRYFLCWHIHACLCRYDILRGKVLDLTCLLFYSGQATNGSSYELSSVSNIKFAISLFVFVQKKITEPGTKYFS